MRTLVCTLKFPDGVEIVAKARAHMPGEEVEVEWNGQVERLGPIVTLVKYAPASLKWYLEARAQAIGAKFEFRFEGDSEPGR
jgi:hypothetical protein